MHGNSISTKFPVGRDELGQAYGGVHPELVLSLCRKPVIEPSSVATGCFNCAALTLAYQDVMKADSYCLVMLHLHLLLSVLTDVSA